MNAIKKSIRARNAPYGLGQMVRSWGSSVKVNPYTAMSDADLAIAAPGMTREEAAIEFERGWHYEGEESEAQPAEEKMTAWDREYGLVVEKLRKGSE